MNNADKPSYPIWTEDMPVEGNPGLTKRERFAMAAMQGLIANPTVTNMDVPNDSLSQHALSDWAVHQADALLKALEE